MKIKQIIIGILVIGVIFGSCKSGNGLKSVSDLTVISKETSEGISFEITNIPENSTKIWGYVYLESSETVGEMSSMFYFYDNEIEQLRKNGKLVCPFVENGKEYRITVISSSENEFRHSSTTAIANGGVYLENKPTLFWNNNNVELSARPIFSEQKYNSQNNMFGYGVSVRNDNGGVGNRDYSNELNFNVSKMVNEICEKNELTGELSAFADITVLLEYEKIKWEVFFAMTDDIIVTL